MVRLYAYVYSQPAAPRLAVDRLN
ncbi:protein of unknown function [Rhodovastum atsumiense]|nr:protein of unknown function [Rhodovastum atsumiense]